MNRAIVWSCCFLWLMAGASAQDAAAKKDASSQPAAMFATYCAGCHGSDGRGGERAPNIATDREIVGLSDARLREIVGRGVLPSGMPAFGFLGDGKVRALVEHLRKLQGVAGGAGAQLPGDPEAGEQIFFGAASCSNCHSIMGRGGFLGEDLSAYARGRSADAVRTAIVHPGNPGHLVAVETAQGAVYKGLVRASDNFDVVLESEDGAFHSLSRDAIRKMTVSSEPLMPQDYGSKLESKQIDDLVSYLMKSSGDGKAAPAEGDDDD